MKGSQLDHELSENGRKLSVKISCYVDADDVMEADDATGYGRNYWESHLYEQQIVFNIDFDNPLVASPIERSSDDNYILTFDMKEQAISGLRHRRHS